MIRRSIAARLWRALCLLALLLPLHGHAQEAGSLESQPAENLVEHPLSPPDISSPRATLETFLSEAKAAVRAAAVGDIETMRARANRLFRTFAVEPPRTEAEFLLAAERSLALLEVLIRLDLPPAEAVPGGDTPTDELPAAWTVPETEIRIVRQESEAGEFIGYRFTADTLARAEDFYHRIRHLPPLATERQWSGYFERFKLRPGFDAPQAFTSLVHSLPEAAYTLVAGEPLWKWLTLLLAAALAAILFRLGYRFAGRLEAAGEKGSLHAAWARPLVLILFILLIVFMQYIAIDIVRLTGRQRQIVVAALAVLGHVATVWLVFLVVRRVVDAIIRFRDLGVHALDAQLARLVGKVISVLVSLYILVHLAETLEIPIAPLIAGLGVGGLAVALAVRPTLENVVAGFVLFADKPVRVGEFCAFSDKLGTVESIGLRSVQIRGLDRTVITIPNAEFCQLQITNFSRRDSNLFHSKLGLRYETTADQLRLVLARLRELLIRHPKVSMEPARVRFLGYGDYSLDVEIFAFVHTRDWGEFLAIQEDINLRIKDIVAAAGTDFAFPSQTLYLQRGQGLDPESQAKADEQVERWREENRLPFPDHEEGFRFEIANTLDYPPEGSAGRRKAPDINTT